MSAIDAGIDIALGLLGAGSIFILLAWETVSRRIRACREAK